MISIYRAEVLDGLSDQIQSSTSIAYCTKINKAKDPDKIISAFASKRNTNPGLYPFDSILVSTGWNKNYDVFDQIESWNAKHTPEDKPLNFEHDSEDIVGHITKSWVIDSKNVELDSSLAIEDIVDSDFHIATSAVLYKVWDNPKNVERIEKTISEIENGEWFVSMECVFRGFDYALKTNDQNRVIARNEQTAFLTKYLRQYGGAGEYQGHQIGRVLRNIVFSGKGLVRNPANPNSVIFTTTESFSKAKISSIDDLNKETVYINSNDKIVQEKNMSEAVESMTKLVDELKSNVAQLTKERDELKKSLAEIDIKAAESKIASLDAVVKTKTSEVDTLTKKLDEATAKVTDLEKQVVESNNKAAEAEKTLASIQKQTQVTARKAALKEKGVEDDKLDKVVSGFDGLTDDQFNLVVSMMVKAAPDKKEETDSSTQGSLDDVVVDDEPALSVGSTDTGTVADDIANFFAKSKKVEG